MNSAMTSEDNAQFIIQTIHMGIDVQPVRSLEIQMAVACRFTMYLRFNGLYNELCIVFGSQWTVHLLIYIVLQSRFYCSA